MLVTKSNVGNYDVTVAYFGILSKLKTIISRKPRYNVTLQDVIKAVSRAIDDSDVFVDCTCPDFIYRYSYYATKYGYKFGKPEIRPPKITNPDDNIGATCKHIAALLSNKKWLVKVSSSVNNFIKANYEEIIEILGLDTDKFIINKPGRPSHRTGRNINMLRRDKLEIPDEDNEDEEELELSDNIEDSED
jgi:hypothetical protein